ncbi:helix-turn-helix domain-containing protein [Coprobacter tertius]|uniref:XRE family transcriptional regulator n=1 Tax=Coprobacter tertius TaxID=2944915 RepID=A0ABT1MG60_9BACT|nr:XRE family transcriptional regulator [Coprobacter tertius]MCP9611629.1 XRE family transcriptional regulator [Coprobacter tertius]
MNCNNFVGDKIKSLREDKKMTREELAQHAGLNDEIIEKIEDNTDLPALAILLKIARALGVRLGTFLDGQEELGPVVCRSEEQSSNLTFSTHVSGTRRHMDYYSLSGSKANRHMEPFMINIAPADPETYELSSHEGEEFIYVMSGNIEINYGNKTYRLTKGDSIYYDSIVPHHVHADNCEDAQILAVIHIPV